MGLESRLYGDENTPKHPFLRSELLQTLAHEMLNVNEAAGSRLLSSSPRMGSPLGHFHRRLDKKASNMITPQLLEQFRKALSNGDAGCACVQ